MKDIYVYMTIQGDYIGNEYKEREEGKKYKLGDTLDGEYKLHKIEKYIFGEILTWKKLRL